MIRQRIDRYIEESLQYFAGWLIDSDWVGKERDCINRFATGFLQPGIAPHAAISDYGQVRIENAVPQIAPSNRNAVTKDLVIWKSSEEVTWDSEWNAVNLPRAIMEWKLRRTVSDKWPYDAYDTSWLKRFTKKYPTVFGYAVTVDINKIGRAVYYQQMRSGTAKTPWHLY